jgi:hypothetical protein
MSRAAAGISRRRSNVEAGAIRAAAFSDHPNQAQTQFLGPNTVLGKMFRYNSESSHQVAVAATSAKGG